MACRHSSGSGDAGHGKWSPSQDASTAPSISPQQRMLPRRMADRLTKAERSALMARVRQEGTKPELIVRRALSALGARYRLKSKGLPGRPDMLFPGVKVAVYVHGCFWHQHRECRASRIPNTRTEYWKPKLEANVERDARHVRQLTEGGWLVFTVWECETRSVDLVQQLMPIVQAVSARRTLSLRKANVK
jgi:DNA mismatch endonuclease (patch repair protein)